MTRILFILAGILMISTQPALAHTGAGGVAGFGHGFGHPIGGVDHILAMVAVGILAAQLGGRALWMVPATFVSVMLIGGLLGVAGVPVPFVEQGIVGSVIIFGAVIAFGRQLSTALAVMLVGGFAVFHGVAHGAEMPVQAAGLSYGLGFMLATSVLHALGLGLSVSAQSYVKRWATLALRFSGGAVSTAGIALMLL